jgi:aspartate dehydrogenase
MRNIGLIGFGTIGAAIVELWPYHLEGRERLSSILVRPAHLQTVADRVRSDTLVTSNVSAFLSSAPDVIVEAAGHSAVSQYGEQLLGKRREVHILSVGALADQSLYNRLSNAAKESGAKIVIPAGALAGFDGLLSLRVAGLHSVKYTSVKPPSAWIGTPAEERLSLHTLIGRHVVFAGSASDASTRFPRNANLAAAVALAGIGFERTEVELVADSNATSNSGRIQAQSSLARLDVCLAGEAFGENPKTSRITALSVISLLHNRSERIGFC